MPMTKRNIFFATDANRTNMRKRRSINFCSVARIRRNLLRNSLYFGLQPRRPSKERKEAWTLLFIKSPSERCLKNLIFHSRNPIPASQRWHRSARSRQTSTVLRFSPPFRLFSRNGTKLLVLSLQYLIMKPENEKKFKKKEPRRVSERRLPSELNHQHSSAAPTLCYGRGH